MTTIYMPLQMYAFLMIDKWLHIIDVNSLPQRKDGVILVGKLLRRNFLTLASIN